MRARRVARLLVRNHRNVRRPARKPLGSFLPASFPAGQSQDGGYLLCAETRRDPEELLHTGGTNVS